MLNIELKLIIVVVVAAAVVVVAVVVVAAVAVVVVVVVVRFIPYIYLFIYLVTFILRPYQHIAVQSRVTDFNGSTCTN